MSSKYAKSISLRLVISTGWIYNNKKLQLVQPPNDKSAENQYNTHHVMWLSHQVTKLVFHDTALQQNLGSSQMQYNSMNRIFLCLINVELMALKSKCSFMSAKNAA